MSRAVLRALSCGLAALLAAPLAAADCREDAVELRGDWGQARFAVEIADDAQERAVGLMHRPKMSTGAGMLFIYPFPQAMSFWMRNTLIELDMLFIDATGTVKSIHHRAKPLAETPIKGGDDLIAVLEINGGLAKRMGITPGTQLRHPAFATGPAAWPC